MKKPLFMAASIALTLTACNGANKPTAANFTKAINSYLATHGELCITVDGQFPIDVPLSQPGNISGIGSKLMALQHEGLLNETDTSAVVQSLANSLSFGPHKTEQVRRYTVSMEGQKYLKSVMTDFGRASAFCYGLKQVDSVVTWTEPATDNRGKKSQIIYRYKVIDLVPWALRPAVQQSFPEISNILGNASKADQPIVLQLTSNGWDAVQP